MFFFSILLLRTSRKYFNMDSLPSSSLSTSIPSSSPPCTSLLMARKVNFHYYISEDNIVIVGRTIPAKDLELSELFLPCPAQFQCHITIDTQQVSAWIYDPVIKQLVLVPYSSFLSDKDQVYIMMPTMRVEVLSYAKKMNKLSSVAGASKQKVVAEKKLLKDEKNNLESEDESNHSTRRRKVYKNTLERTDEHDKDANDESYKRKRWVRDHVTLIFIHLKTFCYGQYLKLLDQTLCLYTLTQVHLRHGKASVHSSKGFGT